MDEATKKLEKLKKTRSTLRSLTTKLINKIDSLFQNPENVNKEEPIILRESLVEKIDKLKKLDNEIQDLIDIDLIEDEVIAAEEYQERIFKYERKLFRFIKETNYVPNTVEDSISNQITNEISNLNFGQQAIRLPKLTINKYFGDPCRWLDFWNQYENAIHLNKSLNDVDKFVYLKSFCVGPALTAISGLALTTENYIAAIEILQNRFGRKDLTINAHMNKLLNLEAVKCSTNIKALRKLYDEIEINIRSLKMLEVTSGAYGHLLCPILLKLMPEDLTLEYNRKRKSKTEFNISELLEFIKTEIECRESSGYLNSKKTDFQPRKNYQNQHAFALTTCFKNCIFCNKHHDSMKCFNISANEKRAKLKSERRCFKCFTRNHLSINCRIIKFPCKKCGGAHHESVCAPKINTESKIVDSPIINETNTEVNPELIVSSVSHSNKRTVLLQTVNAILVSENKNKIIRCLLDSASHRTFILKSRAKELNLPVLRKERLSIYSFGGQSSGEVEYEIASVVLQNRTNPSVRICMEAVIVNHITRVGVTVPMPWVRNIAAERSFELADMGDIEEISVLIGSDYLWEVMDGSFIRISRSLVMSSTIFGFTVQGSLSGKSGNLASLNVSHLFVEEQESISRDLRFLWDLEVIGVKEKEKNSPVELNALSYFEKNTFLINDRYETKLLFKENHEELSNNFDVAKQRLLNLRCRFERDFELLTNYNNIINEQLQAGIIEECKGDNINCSSGTYYMPHRAVIRNEKATTKMRIVFDASSKSKNAVSLNDCLLIGPNLNPDLLEVLLKFRMHKIALCSDIEKAFLQISVSPDHRDYLRFLWFNDIKDINNSINNHFKIFRMKRVPFGVSCSPFLLSATIRLHIKSYESEYENACEMLGNSYVDDIIYGADTVEKAYRISLEADEIMSKASMKLRKWETNDDNLRCLWRKKGLSVRCTDNSDSVLKVLGLVWNNEEDLLKLDVNGLLKGSEVRKVTKREVLRVVAKIFDPLGIISPFTVTMKCLLQESWERGIDWDEELPSDLELRFSEWLSKVRELENVSISRSYFKFGFHSEHINLYIFCDASLKAYGAVAYFRFSNNGNISTSFVLSKVRVAPLKRLTLPRLELMATVVGSRIADYLRSIFNIEISDVTLFTDSEICLHWIKNSNKMWKPFVANRVQEIHEKTDPQNWKFCQGDQNPADKLTRGLKPHQFLEDNLWFNGPKWLCDNSHNFKPFTSEQTEIAASEDIIKEKSEIVNVLHYDDTDLDFLCKFSSWNKLKRVIAWCLRLSKNNINRQKGPLTTKETLKASEIIIRKIQFSEFSKEIDSLKKGKQIDNKSKILSLNPFLDEQDILRVGGRLRNANIADNQKYPIILPKNHHVTQLIIKNVHESHLHGGTQLVLSAIRQNYWIINGKDAVRKYIWKCLKCCRLRAEKSTQLMADLPTSRVNPGRIFSKVGTDFAGPFLIKTKQGRGIKSYKCYVCVFVCLAVKAIHLEVVSDLSSEAFIATLKRFTARRGKPSEIFSDCGSNFVRANKELKRMLNSLKVNDKFHHYLTSENISWKFNPPSAPHHGGLWESAVKAMKHHLRRTMGCQILTFEEFLTLINQIEACLNSRPICPMSSDPADITALTPGHFLIGAPLTAIPEHDFTQSKLTTLKRWHITQQIFQCFWKCWTNEYLSELQQRKKWQKDCPNFKVNDLVLIRDDNLPPLKWKLGRILQTFPGSDNRVRIVKLKTLTGELIRPITKLSHLPFNN